MSKITLINDYHNTTTNVIYKKTPNHRPYLTANQVNRAEKALCGMSDCKCGGVRGGKWALDYNGDGAWLQLSYDYACRSCGTETDNKILCHDCDHDEEVQS